MFTYKEFKENLWKEIKKHLGADAGGLSKRILTMNNEHKIEALTMVKEGARFAPFIHLDKLYDLYCRDTNLNTCVDIVLEMAATELQKEVEYPDWEEVVQNVLPHLIHLEWNKRIINKKNLAYMKFQEFAVVFKVPVKNSRIENTFYDISHEMLEEFGHTLEELYQYAMENLRNKKIRVMGAGKLFELSPTEEKEIEIKGTDLYMVTNESMEHGANVMLLEDFLLQFAEEYDSDFIIFPSSVNELMFYFNHLNLSVEDMKDMVRDVNESVSPEDRLSNEVYCFKRETGKVEML